MTAREFAEACDLFQQFGKIKDIDFDDELQGETVDPVLKLKIRWINFEDNYVTLGKLENFGCDCCGSYWDEEIYDLDDLARDGYLDKVIDMLEGVLDKKGIGC
jgi:hypothetical protein